MRTGAGSGLRTYLYEYMFYRAVERTKENVKEATGKPTRITVSQARLLRGKVEQELRKQGLKMADPNLPVQPVLSAFDKVLGENVPNYKPLFGDHSMQSMGYRQLSASFMNMIGREHEDARTGQRVPGRSGEFGPRVPVSPYDPRFSSRHTVREAGSELLYFPEDAVDLMAGGEVSRLSVMRSEGLKLFRADERRGRLVEAGGAYTDDDLSGMSELMSYMSEEEYNEVRSWVIEGDTSPNRRDRKYMSPDALERSVAILQELHDQGVPYTISRDRNPGQIKAHLTGTNIDVRLTDRPENELYVGRVYDNGAMIYFTKLNDRGKPVSRPGAPRGADRGADRSNYVPTAQECVKLLRFAQGLPVERTDGRGLVGENGSIRLKKWNDDTRRLDPIEGNATYFSGASQMAVVGAVPEGYLFIRKNGGERSIQSQYYPDTPEGEADASAYLEAAVSSARENLAESIDAEGLIEQFEQYRLVLEDREAQRRAAVEAGEDAPRFEQWEPSLHGDIEIAAIQRDYWNYLAGRSEHLLKPGMTREDYELHRENPQALADVVYDGVPADQVRQHAQGIIDSMVGSYEVDPNGDRAFDPVNVSRQMTSEHGVWRNNDEIVAAIRRLDGEGVSPERRVEADALLGDTFYNNTIKDKLIRFDERSAVDVSSSSDPFISRMGEVLKRTVERNSCTLDSMMIDDNGILRYTATRTMSQMVGADADKERREVTGEIGQLFVRGEYGEIVTKFNGSENYLFVPGYEARIIGQKAGESLSVEERTRLRGYEQLMAEAIEYRVGNDLLGTRTDIGSPTSLNGVYRQLYDVRHEVDFIERSREEGLSDAWRDAILATEGRRVRYGNDIRDGSTINADYEAQFGRGSKDPDNDNFFDAYVLTGGRNMAILTEDGDGYFDPMMTSGAINQGITRYLVESAVVNEDGAISRGDLDDQTPLLKHPDAFLMAYNPFDRQQMTGSNLMQASALTAPTATAMMTFGGWNFDDGMVVSRHFADRYQLRDTEGQMRPLKIGDKLSDLHGNKGVVSLIVDPSMSDADAEARGIGEAVKVFRDNPQLDVVMAPFSAVSRFNGGSAREMMQNARALDLGDKGVQSHAMGDVRFIVTHMAVDAKTRVYDDDDIAAGRGRKASSQLAWSLNSQGASAVMAEFYGNNSSALSNVQEYLVTVGLDMKPDGTLMEGRAAENGERRLISMPELDVNQTGTLNWKRMSKDFGNQIGDKGGDLEIPFLLYYPSIAGRAGREMDRTADGTWRLPLMSSHLRSGQDLGDGTSTTHDYTNHYMAIQEQATRYRYAKERLDSGETLSEDVRNKLQETVAGAQTSAQMAFNMITTDVISKRFSGKYNVFRQQVMNNRLSNSATAVWSADPRLAIDEVGMSRKMALSLGLDMDRIEAGTENVLVWRDPQLRDAGVRYLRVALNDELEGVTINPVMDKSFDGDFDGDAVAVVRLNTEAAMLEAQQKLSVQSNLLDLGQRVEVEYQGDVMEVYPLMMHDALDAKVSQHLDPSLKEWFVDMTVKVNEIHEDVLAGDMSQEDAWNERTALMEQLNGYYDQAVGKQFGDAVLTFEDAQSHLESVDRACIETGAKGSASKLRSYATYLGVELDEDGAFVADHGVSQATRKDHMDVQYAQGVKSFGTGVAGAYSQRGMKNMRNVCPKAVLELTYVVTQSILQSKHDPVEARQKYELLMGPVRDLWRGRELQETRDKDGNYHWEAKYEDGKSVQADAAKWKDQFLELCTSDKGLNVSVNPELVDEVVKVLKGSDGKIVNMEDPEGNHGFASTMDKLAYGGDFDTLGVAAGRNENLFSGENNVQFAPYSVTNLQKDLERAEFQKALGLEHEPVQVRPITRKDVREGTPGRAANKRSHFVTTAGRRLSAADVLASMGNEMDSEGGLPSNDGYEL